MNFKISLAAARTDVGLTQEELAKALGVCPSTITHWENGRSVPNITYVTPLEEVLGLPIYNIRFERKKKARKE